MIQEKFAASAVVTKHLVQIAARPFQQTTAYRQLDGKAHVAGSRVDLQFGEQRGQMGEVW